ncbi:unnamed protein product [Clavelina lepadiformis]|uniref:EF-hand domain-containing protein n=1 Tax=Clavelina lepadiformis TaxID=159417 RepID=A0ABP0H7D7_CLALP
MEHNRSRTIVHLIDYMDWFFRDIPRQVHSRVRNIFSSEQAEVKRSNTMGKKKLQEQYHMKRKTHLSDGDLDQLRETFDFFNVNNTKFMELGKLDIALRALGFNPPDDEMQELKVLLEVDGDTTLDFSEFCMVVEHLKDVKGKQGELRDAFRLFDKLSPDDDDEHVSAEYLREVLTTEGSKMSEEDVKELISLADPSGHGRIKYDDFIDILINTNTTKNIENESNTLQHVKSCALATSSERGTCSKSLHPEHVNDQLERKSFSEDNSQPSEVIDTVAKAVAGPMLLTSAIIIAMTKDPPSRKKIGWPAIQKHFLSKQARERLGHEQSN